MLYLGFGLYFAMIVLGAAMAMLPSLPVKSVKRPCRTLDKDSKAECCRQEQ